MSSVSRRNSNNLEVRAHLAGKQISVGESTAEVNNCNFKKKRGKKEIWGEGKQVTEVVAG